MHMDGQTERYARNKRRIFVAVFPELIQTVTQWMFMAAHIEANCLSHSPSYRTAHLLYKLYSVQLNCTDSNYRIAAATCSAVQHHSTFTVQILYKLNSVQLNCTYSNYGETDWDCYVEFVTVQYIYLQILYKLYTLNLNCTYSNYTEAAATCSAAQQERNCQADVFWSGMQLTLWCCMYI